ncbi:MAG: transcription antitermination factor NusB [Thermodesulfobacteriota bacterium]
MIEDQHAQPGLRRLAREIALRILFFYETGESRSAEEAFHLFRRHFDPDQDEDRVLECDAEQYEQALPYVQDLFFGVISHLEEIDRRLNEASENWRLDRMTRVDRNVMRLALYEMLYRTDIPLKVSINEAIDLGKDFGSEDSGSFINGVLDNIHQRILSQAEGARKE